MREYERSRQYERRPDRPVNHDDDEPYDRYGPMAADQRGSASTRYGYQERSDEPRFVTRGREAFRPEDRARYERGYTDYPSGRSRFDYDYRRGREPTDQDELERWTSEGGSQTSFRRPQGSGAIRNAEIPWNARPGSGPRADQRSDWQSDDGRSGTCGWDGFKSGRYSADGPYGGAMYARGAFGEAGARERWASGPGPGDACLYTDADVTRRSHRGRGPKGYTRSDERLREDICERLVDDPYIDASDIMVECANGLVTLEGTVNSRYIKHCVEDLVDECSGVKDIENRLTINKAQGSSEPPRLSGIASSLESRTQSKRMS